MGEHLVGLDIGGTKTHGVLLAPDGTVLREHRLATVRGADGIVAGAVTAVLALVEGHGLGLEDLAGIGVGVPGMVDAAAGTVRQAVNLGIGPDTVPLAELIASLVRVPDAVLAAPRRTAVGAERRPAGELLVVRIENDLNAAALGAAAVIEGVGSDLAYLAIGTGVAAGVVLDGRLRRGAHGAAGEIGHLPVVADGPRCPCGQRGCLELYASGTAIEARWPSTDGVPAPASLFAAAAAGDVRALALRTEFLDAVASAVQVLVLTFDVAVVVIGGGVCALGEPLLAGVRSRLAERASSSSFLASTSMADRVILAPAGVPVAAVGAALVVRGDGA